MILSFKEYVLCVFSYFELDVSDNLGPHVLLVDELNMDSLQVLEIIILSEAMAHALVMDSEPNLRTLGDAYDYYIESFEAERQRSS